MTRAPGILRHYVDGTIGWIVFDNQARRNALSSTILREMRSALSAFEASDAVRVIVLRGAGTDAFISGADISELNEAGAASSQSDFGNAYDEAISALASSAKPTIAMIHGYCFGGGVGVAAACDMRIADTGSTYSIPAARLGIGYGLDGIRRLVTLIGASQSKRMLYLAERLDAARAEAIGLVDQVVPHDSLEMVVRSVATTLSDNAPLTIRAAKLAIDSVGQPADEQRPASVQAAIDACMDSDDHVEGKRAFLEKRKPLFRGV